MSTRSEHADHQGRPTGRLTNASESPGQNRRHRRTGERIARDAGSALPRRRRHVPAELQPWHPRGSRQGPCRHSRAGKEGRPPDRHPAGPAGAENSGRDHQGWKDFAVAAGEQVRFVLSGSDGDKMSIPLPHPEIFDAVAPGDDLLIDDGRVRVRVTGRRRRFHRCQSRHRRRHLEPQGRQRPERHPEFVAADGRRIGPTSPSAWSWASIGSRCRSSRNPGTSSRPAD